MTWFKVEDSFAFHRKAMEAGNSALGLWVRAGSYCAQQLTDGFVPLAMVRKLGTMSQARRLVNAGLWRETSGGFVFHEFTDDNRNPTANAIRAQRERESTRKAKQRERPHETESQARDSCPSGTTPTPVPPESHDPPDEPVPPESQRTPRVRARRPDQTNKEIPPTAGGEPPPNPETAPIDAGRVVARWSEVYEQQVGRKPSGGMRGQVGREAKQWLGTHDAELVMKAAEQAAEKGYPTLGREISPMVAKQRQDAAADRRDHNGVLTADLPW